MRQKPCTSVRATLLSNYASCKGNRSPLRSSSKSWIKRQKFKFKDVRTARHHYRGMIRKPQVKQRPQSSSESRQSLAEVKQLPQTGMNLKSTQSGNQQQLQGRRTISSSCKSKIARTKKRLTLPLKDAITRRLPVILGVSSVQKHTTLLRSRSTSSQSLKSS